MVARHVGLRRLLKLADHLDTVPPETFDMSTWWCGTRGCAMGHAAQMPAFRRLGLRLEASVSFDEEVTVGVVLEDEQDYGAAAVLFGLTRGEAKDLFCPSTYGAAADPRTPADVAGEIRAFVARARGER